MNNVFDSIARGLRRADWKWRTFYLVAGALSVCFLRLIFNFHSPDTTQADDPPIPGNVDSILAVVPVGDCRNSTQTDCAGMEVALWLPCDLCEEEGYYGSFVSSSQNQAGTDITRRRRPCNRIK
jgi:hypothetical protein